MKDLLNQLIKLQDADSRILEKRLFIDKVPMRVFEVDEPVKKASEEIESIKQKADLLSRKKRDKEAMLDEINEKIKKMKSRMSEIKTNKEYQAYQKEIESFEKEITRIEDEILVIMVDMDNIQRLQREKEGNLKIETEKLNAFKKDLDMEVEKFEKELNLLKAERAELVKQIEPDLYNSYMTLISSGNGIAVVRARNEVCLGCNMNMPPQLFVELKKNEEILYCPQCRRILYYSEN